MQNRQKTLKKISLQELQSLGILVVVVFWLWVAHYTQSPLEEHIILSGCILGSLLIMSKLDHNTQTDEPEHQQINQ